LGYRLNYRNSKSRAIVLPLPRSKQKNYQQGGFVGSASGRRVLPGRGWLSPSGCGGRRWLPRGGWLRARSGAVFFVFVLFFLALFFPAW